jgi:uncharacterized protein RhaS with RHS repeats
LSRDPIGEEGGINLYSYVGGDPINWLDDDGRRRGRTPRGRGNDGRGRDNGGSEPWPKNDKSFCIRTYTNCINYNYTGNCQACLDRCIGSAPGDWPFHMCRPRRKSSCP